MKSTDQPAPPDLAALIDAYRAAEAGDNWRAKCSAYRALIGWRGYCRGVTYHHADLRVFLALGSVKIGEWPRVERPSRAGTA